MGVSHVRFTRNFSGTHGNVANISLTTGACYDGDGGRLEVPDSGDLGSCTGFLCFTQARKFSDKCLPAERQGPGGDCHIFALGYVIGLWLPHQRTGDTESPDDMKYHAETSSRILIPDLEMIAEVIVRGNFPALSTILFVFQETWFTVPGMWKHGEYIRTLVVNGIEVLTAKLHAAAPSVTIKCIFETNGWRRTSCGIRDCDGYLYNAVDTNGKLIGEIARFLDRENGVNSRAVTTI